MVKNSPRPCQLIAVMDRMCDETFWSYGLYKVKVFQCGAFCWLRQFLLKRQNTRYFIESYDFF